eukprot:330194-Karenia_brevis.AAC.1
MPAHTALWQVGVARKSDGSALSSLDRRANDLADRGAKAAAAGRRVARTTREDILAEAGEVAVMAKWIAR